MVICGRRYARSKPVGPERESELPASAKPFHCTPKSARGPYCDRLVRQQIGRDNRDRSQRDLVCRSMRSTIFRSTSLLCSIHPTSSQICTTHTATRLQDGTLRRAGYGAVRDRRHRWCVDSGGAGRPQSDGAADLAAGKGSRRPIARISTWQKSTRVFASGALLLWRSRGIVSVHYKSNY